jgi:hypothetical protein
MLGFAGLPNELDALLQSWDLSFFEIMLIYVAMMLVLGTLLDTASIILIVVPLFITLIEGMGLSLVWFGIVTVIGAGDWSAHAATWDFLLCDQKLSQQSRYNFERRVLGFISICCNYACRTYRSDKVPNLIHGLTLANRSSSNEECFHRYNNTGVCGLLQ